MEVNKKSYIDLLGLSKFKELLLKTSIDPDKDSSISNKTPTVGSVINYVNSVESEIVSAVNSSLNSKVNSVSYDTTNKKFTYTTGSGTSDIVTIATLKSAIGNFGKSGSGASAGLVPAPSTTAGSSKYLREDGTWATPPTYTIATSSTLGLVKSQTTGTTSNRDYGVQVNTDGTMKVNVPWTDTKVTSTASNTTKAYLVGSTSSSTSTDTLIKDTNIYLDTTAGKLVATTFSGSLSGNATTATKATQDSSGQQINTTYIKGLSVNGKVITYTRGDDTTGTITTQDTTYVPATQSANGLISSTDKKKLDGIASGAEVNQNAFSNVTIGNTTIEADSKTDTLTFEAGNNITLTPDVANDKITISAKDTTYSVMTGATSEGAGTLGLVPAPAKGKQSSFLRGDGTWAFLEGTTYTIASGDNNGQIKVTPSSGSAYNVTVKGLNTAAYRGVDTSPTSGSTNVITSGGVYTVIGDINAILDNINGEIV